MKTNISLLTARLRIRTLRVDDITLEYVKGLNASKVNKFLVNTRLKKQTRKMISDFILHNLDSPDDILLGVFLKNSDAFIGTIRIGDISRFHYLCNIGICFFIEKYWGKGYASEALKKICDFIFTKFKLHYVEAGVYKDNYSSMRLFERAGFKIRAFYKDKYRHQGDFAPVAIWGLTNPKFNKKILR